MKTVQNIPLREWSRSRIASRSTVTRALSQHLRKFRDSKRAIVGAMHWKKWSNFDLKSWVTCETKIRPRIPSNWRIFESNWVYSESQLTLYSESIWGSIGSFRRKHRIAGHCVQDTGEVHGIAGHCVQDTGKYTGLQDTVYKIRGSTRDCRTLCIRYRSTRDCRTLCTRYIGEVDRIVSGQHMRNPVLHMRNTDLRMKNPVLCKKNPVLCMENPVLDMGNPVLCMENPVLGMGNPVLRKRYPVLGMKDPVLH